MGKYIPTNSKPRPLLVSFNNSYQVSTILANRSKLASTNLTIKPHMSKLERLIETMLLKERRRLINNKTPPKHIRILRNKLLVSGQVHAQVTVINDKCQLDFVIHGEIVQTPPCANQPLPPNHSNLTNVCNPAANHLPTCTRLSKSMKSFDIKMITWNARSIKSKLTFIQSFTFTKSIHILCLTETWLLPTINNNEILPSKYEIVILLVERHLI